METLPCAADLTIFAAKYETKFPWGLNLEIFFIPKIVVRWCVDVQLVNIFQYEEMTLVWWGVHCSSWTVGKHSKHLSDDNLSPSDLQDQTSITSAWRSEEGGAGGLIINVPGGGGEGGPGGPGGPRGPGQEVQCSTWLHSCWQTGWRELIGNIQPEDNQLTNTYQHLPTVWNYNSITGEY